MGSNKSKPRKGHEKPKHLPKVGTPENLEWRHQGEMRDAFGPPWLGWVIGIVLIGALVGWLFLTM